MEAKSLDAIIKFKQKLQQQNMSQQNSQLGSSKFQSIKQQQLHQTNKLNEQQEQTINSEEDLESEFQQQSVIVKPSNQIQVESYERVEVNLEPPKEVAEQLITETYEEKPLNLVFQPSPSMQQNQLFTYKQSNRQREPFKQMSLSQSMNSNISQVRKPQINRKINAFYYDRIGDSQSLIFMKDTNKPKLVALEIVIPISIAFVLEVIILVIQNEIGEFCFIQGIACSNYWIRLWSFVKQQLLFKLGIVFCKGHILYQLVLGNKLLKQTKNGRPLMEYMVLISMTISTDFIMIFWVGFNEDWLFIVYMYIIGFVVFFNTFRMKTWPFNIKKGFSFFWYDITIIALLFVCFKLLPYIKQSLKDKNSVAWNEYYMFIYAFLDLGMEVFMNICLSFTKYSELYIYQSQLLIIATRVGTLIQGDMMRFDFWFCLFFLILFRINDISLVFTVFIRRIIYYAAPDSIKPFVSMEETNLTRKGKNGACWEHLVWIIYFYMFIFSGRTFTHWVFDKSYIDNGKFETSIWNDYTKSNYMPPIVWVFLLVPEIIGYWLNKQKNYDNIKLLGGNQLKFHENMFIRIMGVYLFNFALMSNLV